MLAKTILITLLPIFVAAQADLGTATSSSSITVTSTSTDSATSTTITSATSTDVTITITSGDATSTTDVSPPADTPTDGGDYDNNDGAPVAGAAWPTNTLVTAPAQPPCNSTSPLWGGAAASPTQTPSGSPKGSGAGMKMPNEAFLALVAALAGSMIL